MITFLPTVFVVDDEPSMRKALERLLRAAGLTVATFASAQDYLDRYDAQAPGCLVLDLAMPGFSGLELQTALEKMGGAPAIIFLTGQAEVPDGVQAMKHGAVEFFTKPVLDATLIEAVLLALDRDRVDRSERARRSEIRARLATLTPREVEVLDHVVSGKLNKQIADKLGTAEKTIKVHRGRVMEKMQAGSLAQLVTLAAAAHAKRPEEMSTLEARVST